MLSPFAMLANNQKYFTSENKEHRQHDEDLFDDEDLDELEADLEKLDI